MIKAFLSHSSADKKRYVSVVARILGPQNSIYDEYTFEEGMKSLEEIIKGIDDSQVFVLFLSEQALSSKWVADELKLAHEKLEARELQRIFPIIIDPSITHLDKRLPQWMRDDYNLKYVSRPTVAARRIRQRLREASWLNNPRLKERDEIFVGRNNLIEQVEQRIDNYEIEKPICFVASGLQSIGRSSLLRRALIKSNIVRQSYEFPSIILHRGESIDDFLLKIHDLGLSNESYPKNLLGQDIEYKLEIVEKIIRDIQTAREIILIRDEGCIINYTREIQPWFDGMLRKVESTQLTTFIISAKYRPLPEYFRHKQYYFAVNVPELNNTERRGLFARLVDFEKLALSGDDYAFFTDLLDGYPDQVQFACDNIRDLGLAGARKVSHEIKEYNSDKAAIVIKRYSDHPKLLDFLYLLSEFEFISLDFLFSLVREDEYAKILEEFIAACICDYVGIEKEFIRLNDTIRDYVRRGRTGLPEEFKKKLSDHIAASLASLDEEQRDISDILYSIKEGIKLGQEIPQQYLIPSHFIQSMRELYQKRGHLDRVIELADKLLEKKHVLDNTIAQDARYYLCLSLARKRDGRMLKEVQEINGPEHNFLLGFYYRLQGRYSDAIEQQKECVRAPIVATRAKHELVQAYLGIEDYESASELAKINYEEKRRNEYNIQAYFNSIVNSSKVIENRDLLLKLIAELKAMGSDTANEMADIAEAEFLAKCDDNYPGASDRINDAISKYPDSHYPLLVKAFLAANNLDKIGLESAYDRLKKMSGKRNISEISLDRLKCYIYVLEGNLDSAISYANEKLKRIPEYSRDKFLQRLRDIHARKQAS